jgi:hypothetical protein
MRKRIYIGLICFGIILVILSIFKASSSAFEESTEFGAPNDYKDIIHLDTCNSCSECKY